MKIFENSEIAIIPSRWEEPFGRTALEASSRGCATIISNRGGLTETTNHALVLNKININTLTLKLNELIKNEKLRRKLQINGFKNVRHDIIDNSKKLMRCETHYFHFHFLTPTMEKLEY